MVFGSRNRQGGKQSGGSGEIDLLTTLFGLPNRQTLECERRQRARRAVISYVVNDDQRVGAQQDPSSSSESESESDSECENP